MLRIFVYFQSAGGRFYRSTLCGPRGFHLLAVVAQRRVPEIGPLGHGQVQHRSGRVQPSRRRTAGVGNVRQLRGPQHADRPAGLQGTWFRQAGRLGGHQGNG